MNLNAPLSHVMTTRLLKVRELDVVEAVCRIFEKNEIHHVPVENADEKLVGIISKSDFLKISYGLSLFNNPDRECYNITLYKTILVKDIMTSKVVTLRSNDTVHLAAQIFRENLFHAIPIVEGEKLVGIVTTYDLLNFAFKPESPKATEMEAYLTSLE
jgi:CBS domain-containing protein